MKRFVIATASALILLAGSAAASVPKGPASRLAHANSFSSSANGGPGVETMPVGLAPLAPGIDPAVLADPDLALPGLPGGVTQLFGAVDPALATLAGVVPPAVSGLLPPVAAEPAPPIPGLTPAPAPPPSEQKKAEPAPAPARKQAKGLTRKAADLRPLATATDIFKNLPATGHAAYGTGSVIHVHALEANGQRLENTDAAFSGATFSSAPIAEIKNEVSRIVAPALLAGNAFGRGSGLEVGLGIQNSGPNQIIPGNVAEAKAPPSTGLVTKEVGPIDVPPIAYASLLRGQAQSKANAACTTGTDLSYGLGYASDLRLLNAALGSPTVGSAAESPTRAASQSRSRTFLVPQDGAPSPIRKFGLASETRMTIAPITLFKGVAGQELTLEFAGEWVLRTVADGKTATVHYGPGEVSPSTPLLRVLRPGQPVEDILTTQGVLGPDGLTVDVSPLLKVVVGAPPRMIGGADNSQPIKTATLAAAAVDVVKIQVLANQSGLTVADLRIGHMENATAVPAGGIECGIGLVKNTDKELVGPGDSFIWTIKVTNPNDCVLTKLKIVDTITATTGIIWTVDKAEPKADQVANSGVTWNDVGPLNPGQSKDLKIFVKLGEKTGGGRFLDVAEATGVCGPAAGTAGADAAVGVPLQARVELNLPEVSAVQAGNLLPRELPRTGGMIAVLPALALTGGGLILRQTRRRKQR